jgi:hypothetical protein
MLLQRRHSRRETTFRNDCGGDWAAAAEKEKLVYFQ